MCHTKIHAWACSWKIILYHFLTPKIKNQEPLKTTFPIEVQPTLAYSQKYEIKIGERKSGRETIFAQKKSLMEDTLSH